MIQHEDHERRQREIEAKAKEEAPSKLFLKRALGVAIFAGVIEAALLAASIVTATAALAVWLTVTLGRQIQAIIGAILGG